MTAVVATPAVALAGTKGVAAEAVGCDHRAGQEGVVAVVAGRAARMVDSRRTPRHSSRSSPCSAGKTRRTSDNPLEGAVRDMQLPAQLALQSSVKPLQQFCSPAHHESQ